MLSRQFKELEIPDMKYISKKEMDSFPQFKNMNYMQDLC